MNIKEQMRFGIVLLGVFADLMAGIGVAGAQINIECVYVEDGITRFGWIHYRGTEENNTFGTLVVEIDCVEVLNTEVEARVRIIGNQTVNRYGFEYFEINETVGRHIVQVVIVSEDGEEDFDSCVYEGRGKEEEEEEVEPEEILEDWLECP